MVILLKQLHGVKDQDSYEILKCNKMIVIPLFEDVLANT